MSWKTILAFIISGFMSGVLAVLAFFRGTGKSLLDQGIGGSGNRAEIDEIRNSGERERRVIEEVRSTEEREGRIVEEIRRREQDQGEEVARIREIIANVRKRSEEVK